MYVRNVYFLTFKLTVKLADAIPFQVVAVISGC